MQPSHAEVARTLAAGHLPASAHIACRPGPFPVRHVTDARAGVLLLSPARRRADRRAAPDRRQRRHRDRARHLRRAAVAGAPSLGRVWVAGWAVALTGDEAREAAARLRRTRPDRDLLDVGDGPGAAPDGGRRGPLRAGRHALRRRPRRVRRGHARTRCGPSSST